MRAPRHSLSVCLVSESVVRVCQTLKIVSIISGTGERAGGYKIERDLYLIKLSILSWHYAKLKAGVEATHYAKVTRPGKVRGGSENLKPQHTVATVRVMCTSCEAHTEVPAQKVNRAAGKSTVYINFAKHNHKHACKNGASTLQTQLSLDGLPAGGGWKPCCSGRLKVARST
jgi:hypothetical protein